MKTVCNATPLIYLSKLNRLEFLKMLFGEIFIADAVYEEVVIEGKQDAHTDAVIVERAIEDGWINVVKAKERKELKLFEELDQGEMETISLALDMHPDLVLIDEAPARQIARSLHLQVKGTVYVLLLAYQKRMLKKDETKQLLAALLAAGFRLAPELYAKILNELEKY